MTATGSAGQALEVLAGAAPDVILCDIGLPGDDGHVLLQKIRATGCDAPAIAVTAYAQSRDREQTLAAGFIAHLAKPASPEDLITAIARATDDAAWHRLAPAASAIAVAEPAPAAIAASSDA